MGDYYAGRKALDAATGNWQGVYENYKQFVIIKDSAFNKEILQKLVSSQVQIKLHKQTDGALHLEVPDNGMGKSGVIHGVGFGGQLVSLLTQQLSGSMREVKNGTRIYFEFKPIKAA